MKRFNIINLLISNFAYKSYLEIGIRKGNNFKKIKCDDKTSVDVINNKYVTHHMSSNEFFKNNTKLFDIIFIDGLHEYKQVQQDINNALKNLKKDGTIVCHDMNPTSEIMQQSKRKTNEWTGDCWKAWIELRQTNENIYMYVVDTDYGCGIIQNGYQNLINIDCEINYNNFDKNRKKWLNLISIEEFKNEL